MITHQLPGGNAATITGYSPVTLGKLAQWLEQQRPKGVTRFLSQRQTDVDREKTQLMSEFTWEDAENDANKLAIAICERIEQEGRIFPGKFQSFAILAVAGDVHKDHYWVTVPGAGEAPVYDAREMSGGQIAAQLMAHSGMSVQFAIGHTNDIVAHYKEQVADWKERCRELETKLWELAQSREAYEAKKYDHELNKMRLEQDDRRMETAIGMIVPHLPGVLQLLASSVVPTKKVTAGEGAAGAPAPGEDAKLDSLLVSLTPEQIIAIQAILTPAQQLTMQELYQAYGERDLARRAAAREAAAKESEKTTSAAA